MRHMAKRALSLLLALLLCLTLFPAVALAEEGTISPVGDDEDGGLSGTPAHTEEVEPESPVGDGVLDVPSDDPAALPLKPAADEIQSIVASGTCGENLTWTLDDAGVLTISGSGAMTYWNPQEAPWYSQRENIQTVQIEENITNIGSAAFYGCSRLTSVTISESVTSIGVGAFFNCSSLTSVMIPSSVTSIEDSAFQDCSSLKIVLFQGNPPWVWSKAFYNDQITALYPIDNPAWTADKLKNYGDGTMTWVGYRDEAASYTIHFDANGGSNAPEDQIKGHNVDITLTDAVPDHEKGTFLGWSTRPDATEPVYLPGRSFSRNADTTLYAVWEGVPSIVASGTCGENLTWTLDDTGLLTISGEGDMTDWNSYAKVPWYSQRESIHEVQIGEGVSSIGDCAFSSIGLMRITIPASITSIGESSMARCYALHEILVAEGNKSYASVDGVLYDFGVKTLIQCPGGKTGAMVIPDSVTIIKDEAFASCTSLTSVTIPESVTRIRDSAFDECSSLKIVLFRGNAPFFFSNVFSQDQLNAVYPIDNPTWTADKLQNYGGTLTWVGYRDEAKAYSIHFDANGGSDAPEDQIKGHNVDITLTSAVPGREDTSFLGWSTRRWDAEPEYLPGESFDRNEDTTLFALWEGALPEGIVAAGTCGENLTWTLDDAGLLTISGEGEMTNWSYIENWAPWYSQRTSIREIRIDTDVTTIGDYAFYSCSSLTSVTIPDGVIRIESRAFSNCFGLTELTIPDSVTSIGAYAFERCTGLASVMIPAGVTSIGDLAFLDCRGLTSVTIPESVTSIGEGAFSSCGSLQEILVAEGNKAYASVDGVLYDASLQTFLQCPGGKTGAMTIPASVTSIGPFAFQGCSSLTTVTIPSGVTTIGHYAFAYCSSLTSVTIPEGVTHILYGTFRGCSSLTNVTIPAGVTNIKFDAFTSCHSLKFVLFQGSAPSILSGAFSDDHITAVYPIDDPTWTADKLQDYGGDLTWVGYRDVAAAYTIHFDANGGSDAPEDQIKGHNVEITLTSAVPGREDASFLGWSTRRGAREPDYLPGSSFGLNVDTTLYAVWKRNAPVLPTEAVLTLGSDRVCAGQEFTVELTMEKNPGLMYLSFRLDYDADELEFLGAEDGAFSGWMVNTEKRFLTWDSNEDRTENGVLLRLRFRAKEEARTGETAIALADLFATNYAEELLGIGSVPGTVTILPHTPGDATGDGEVDGRDLVRLRKYLAGDPGFEVVEANTNVNGDDVIDILDLVRLRKYLAQYDVILE